MGLNDPERDTETLLRRYARPLEWISDQDFDRNPEAVEESGFGAREYDSDWCVTRSG